MNIELLIKRLRDVEEKMHIESGYSHVVYDIFNIVLDTSKYALVDTSTLKRSDTKPQALKNLTAVPDFIITSHEYNFGKADKSQIYGCIEVKYNEADVNKADRLSNDNEKMGYLDYYKNVLFTNGWIWSYYKKDSPTSRWTINLNENSTNKEYGKLLKNLCSIEWGS